MQKAKRIGFVRDDEEELVEVKLTKRYEPLKTVKSYGKTEKLDLEKARLKKTTRKNQN